MPMTTIPNARKTRLRTANRQDQDEGGDEEPEPDVVPAISRIVTYSSTDWNREPDEEHENETPAHPNIRLYRAG